MSRVPDSNPPADQSHSGGKWFEATEWTVILKARSVDGPAAAAALERFARSYWKPLFCFIRRQGYNKHDAEDLTQGFYQHFLGKHLLERVTEPSGKFRTFLLTCLNHFLSDEKQRRNAIKREGGHQLIALDALEEDERNGLEPADHLTADQVYDRQWAAEIIKRAVERLREYYAEQGKRDLFEQLKNLQPGERGTLSCAQIGATLGMTEQAVKNARHAFKKRYSTYLREEVSRTVGSIDLIQEELTLLSDGLGP
jgi:DNA-directed RNA polymerase specialized sigma24 family protein